MLNRRLVGVAAGVLTAIGAVAWFMGCSATIDGGGGDAGLRLSSGKLNPGQFLTVFHSSISAGTKVVVNFVGPGGFDVEVETILTDNGSARIAVPPLIDMQTGEFLEGEVRVSLSELSGGSVALTVQALPQIDSPFPGALLREVLLISLEVADAAEAKAAAIAADLPDAVESPSDLEFFTQQRAAVAGILEELDATGQLTVETANGTIVTLTAQDLALGDRLLASYLVGIIDETGGDSSVALKTATRLQGQGGSILDFEALKKEYRRVANNIYNGGGAYLGSMTLIVAAGILIPGAAPVAAAGGVLLTVGSAVWANGSSSIANRIGSFFDQKLGGLFNTGNIAFNQAISVGTEALGTLKGKFGQLFSGVSTLLTAQSTYENFTRLECQINPAQPKAMCCASDGSCTLVTQTACATAGGTYNATSTTCFPNLCPLPAPGQKRGSNNSQQKSRQPLLANVGFCTIVRPPGGGEGVGCTNTCASAADGFCDDGGTDSSFDICFLGTDCADCGVRDVSVCSDSCSDSGDGICDDGGPGALFAICVLGTDCADCGARDGSTEPEPEPEPEPEIVGACCAGGGCTTTTEAECAFDGGVYQGDDSACSVCATPAVEYVVWYTGNVSCWSAPLIYIDTRDSFNIPGSAASYPYGGIDFSIPLQKVELEGGFASMDEARAWICPQFEQFFYHNWCSPHYFARGQWWLPGGLGCDLSNVPQMLP